MRILLALFILSLTGCSNAQWADVKAWGQRHHVKCWSGGVVIYDGHTTGKIENEDHSDGYFFQEEESGQLVRVSGNCLITVGKGDGAPLTQSH